MLRSLQIQDYTLIDKLELDFHSGLNLLTGETGSGKSIVVEAVGLLLGEKASADLVRTGADRARIIGVFSPDHPTGTGTGLPDATGKSRWRSMLEELARAGIDTDGADELILQREILSAGRSRCFINHQPATATLLRSIAPSLAEVHGQNEQQELFLPATQRELLDRFGGLAAQVEEVRDRHAAWTALVKRLEAVLSEQRDWLRQMDLWQFQDRELQEAGLREGEDRELEEEKLILTHAERIRSRLASGYEQLYNADMSAASLLASAQRDLEEVASYDTGLQPLAESLLSARATAEDVALTMRDRLANLEASPERLEQVETRLAAIDRLKKKFGPSLAEVIAYRDQLRTRMAEAESSEFATRELEEQVREAAANYGKAAEKLSAARRRIGGRLKTAIEKELGELAMAGTVFEIQIVSSASEQNWRASGLDRVGFLLSANPGEPLQPLSRVASGGEVSRIMLALETVVASRRGTDTSPGHSLIFDEVDVGIGGRAAESVGRKLRRLGDTRQVLCVTHLPQIASFAEHHYRVEKMERDGRTVTRVDYLDAEGRHEELARMLSGTQVTPALRKHAKQLLKSNAG